MRQAKVIGLATPSTWERGVAYARADKVQVSEVQPAEGQVEGTCRGSGQQIYTVRASCTFKRDGSLVSIWGNCNCPVGRNCKHSVALALVGFGIVDQEIEGAATSATDRLKRNQPEWKRQLVKVFPTQGGLSDHTAPVIGLQFEFTVPRNSSQRTLGRFGMGGRLRRPWKHEGARLELRPVAEGKTKKWVRNTVTWTSIRGRTAKEFDPAALSIFERLCDLADRTSYRSPTGGIPLDVAQIAGMDFWEILGDLGAAGIPLLQATTDLPVTIEPTAAQAIIDITCNADGEMKIVATLRHSDALAETQIFALGDPTHTVVWENHWGLHLAPVESSSSNAWVRLRDLGGEITVPAEEVDDFMQTHFPAVNRAGWESSDGSFTPPPVPPPTLNLSVTNTHDSDSLSPQLRLQWGWRQAASTAESGRLLPLHPSFGQSGRDTKAEGEILLQVQTILENRPELFTPDGHRLIPDAQLRGLAALEFLNKAVPQLEDLGVLVQRIEIPQYRQAHSAEVSLGINEDLDSHDWLDLRIAVMVDDHQVPLGSLISAIATEEEVLFLEDGTYLPLDDPEFSVLRGLLEEARGLSDARSSSLRVSPTRLSWWEDLLNLGIVQTTASQWFTNIRQAITTEPIEVPLPKMLQATLRDYQIDGFQWLANLRRAGLGGILADDMGLGKTVQTLAMIADERENPTSSVHPWLVVAPTSVVGNWLAEARRFTPNLKVKVVEATKSRRDETLQTLAEGTDILVTSFALLRLESEDYADISWAGLIIDEAQNAKNYRAKVFSSLMKVGAPSTYAITGTPMENNLGELWSMLALTTPGMMGSPKQFSQTYQKPIEAGGPVGDTTMQLLRRRIAPFLLRRTKENVAMDLPEKQEQIFPVSLNAEHRRLYDRHLDRERQRVLGLLEDADHNQVEILASLTRLRQLAIDPGLVAGQKEVASSKSEALIPLLTQSAEEGHRIIVFSQFTRYLRRIAAELEKQGLEYAYLDGSTTNRQQVLDDFRQGSAPVFLMSLKAGGVGINLTEVDYAVLTDPWWNPAVESQAIARAHRIGQTRPVHVYRLVSQDTIEEKMLSLQESKRQLAEALLAEDSASARVGGSRLTAEDIELLLS